MQNIFGNKLDLNTLTQPVDCYCISKSNFCYDKYRYTVINSLEPNVVHEFHEAHRLILVPVGKALCTDAGEELKVGMFLN